jgi:DNA-binding LacI/PurR family transcriptional regulator
MQPVALMSSRTVHTIADVARLAGVSKSTVSRALNDSPLIGDETKERIRAIAAEHRFQLNVPARRLSLKQSNTIAFVTYAYHKDFSVPDIFMLEIMSGISAGLLGDGYDMLIVQVDPNDSDWARAYLETGRADGFILLEATCTQSHIEALLSLGAPFVLWGTPAADHRYSSVSGDSVTGGRIAVEHLLRVGRRRIAFLGGPAKALEVQDRYLGYETALREAGLAVDPLLVGHGNYTALSGAETMRALLDRAPDLDSVFVNSDTMAIAAMDAIRSLGRSVPDDVAVIGYDDIAIAQQSNPPLTTVRQNGPLAGKLLAQNLVQSLRTGVVTSVSIPAELVVRQSA